ncbi:alpha/beta fold hydrolase [Sneathiella aquimaris]|uniref:alpha/beta fold hydrolase n=1 Tax=Sneathiella aquimaris TaxID=2599305 RepID=UPI00146F2088|nr:alpha/beta hydrolase [Sneathiella aquimaris]
MSYAEKTYKSNDGLTLYYRVYGTDDSGQKSPVICLSGLTRNSGDFNNFAERYSKDRNVYALDYRGRGKSDYDPAHANYNPQTYLGDIFTFLGHEGIQNAVFVGTSLGGILSMALAALAPQYFKAVLLNDIGPQVASSGGDRIAGYVGNDVRYPSIEDAVQAQKSQYISAYPDITDAQWKAITVPAFTWDEDQSNYRPNYDIAIGVALKEQLSEEQAVDLWPFFEALKPIPTLAIRGALSDVLSAEVFAKMKAVKPDLQTLELQNRGHVPLLDEPEAIPVIDAFMDAN